MRIYPLSSYSVGNYCADISAIGPKELNWFANRYSQTIHHTDIKDDSAQYSLSAMFF